MSKFADYTLLDTAEALQQFCEQHADIEWLGFDTEFVGEKRYFTALCLIQVATEHGLFLIDPFKVTELDPFLAMISDERILKITHAGENDYRLLHQNFETVPKNVFDTQVAAGFLGYGYPTSFMKLVESELHIRLDKGYAVTDWESRPIKPKQLEYALNDVIPLYELHQKMSKRLKKLGRLAWAATECRRWETPEYYFRDPYGEAINNTMMYSLKQSKQVFLLRLYEWRREEAKRKNYSKEMILPAKLISPIVRNIDIGKERLLDDRTIPNGIIEHHWRTFVALYEQAPQAAELAVLEQLSAPSVETAMQQVSMELLHSLVKYKCVQSGVATSLVLHKSELTFAQPGEDIFVQRSDDADNWRRDFLGEALVSWLNRRGELDLNMDSEKVTLTMQG
jgi:ribonuclease D